MAIAKTEPNIVPLCDVLLVLLIIFMIISPLIQQGFDVVLPGDGDGSPMIVVTLKPDNIVLINQEEIELNKIQSRLRSLFENRSERTIFVRAYADVPFQKLVELIGMIKGAGIQHLALITEHIKKYNT